MSGAQAAPGGQGGGGAVADKIARMANQIATAFASRREAEQAAGVAGHINDYWEPRMRRHLLAQLAADPGGFHPILLAARPLIRAPAPAEEGGAVSA